MNKKLENKISKTLSYLLRHNPKQYGVELDYRGFADINTVINGLKKDYPYITIEDLNYIVKNDDKGRYEIKDNLIRALYGHSIKKEIEKVPSKPPVILYHGTKENVLDSILKEGIKSMKRQKVCLSSDINTAKMVGDRRKNSNTIILKVRAEEAYNDGINFYTEPNGIYMSDDIPPKYIEILK